MPKAIRPPSAPITAPGTDIVKLSLGPNPYFWPRTQTLGFYRKACDWPVDIIYLGETICSKRRELRTKDWIALACELAAAGKEVVLSSLSLVEAESELGALQRMVDDGRFLIEANDLSAVQACRRAGRPFVAGPTLNVYNHRTLALLLEDGMQRWVPGVEQGRDLIRDLLQSAANDGVGLPELEVIVWGRLALSYSARCFTARALDVAKDDCAFRCIEFPDGLALKTRDRQPFLRINGIQVLGEDVCDLGPELPEVIALGAGIARVIPQAERTDEVLARFRGAIMSRQAASRLGHENGYWRGGPGFDAVPAG